MVLVLGTPFKGQLSKAIIWFFLTKNLLVKQTVVVAQLVERSLPTTEIYGLNPNIGKFYLPIAHLNRKGENKVKEAGTGPS